MTEIEDLRIFVARIKFCALSYQVLCFVIFLFQIFGKFLNLKEITFSLVISWSNISDRNRRFENICSKNKVFVKHLFDFKAGQLLVSQ